MASIKERKDKDGKTHYQVDIRLKGYPRQHATFARLTDAKKWAQDTEVALRNGRHFRTAEAKKHTLGEMIDRYIENVLPLKKKCMQGQQMQLLWWKKQIGSKLLADVSPALIAEQRDRLLKEITVRGTMRSPATTVRYLAVLSHAFTIAIKEWGWLEDSPMRKVKKPKEPRGRVRFLSDNERERLLTACKESPNPYLYIVVVLAVSTGMRYAEIMNLKWSDIDLEKGRIILEEQKNGDRDVVPLTGHALQLLRNLGKIRRIDSKLLFPSKEDPAKPIDLRFPWERAVQHADIQDFTFHCLRHTAASYLAMNNASLVEIAQVLRHKTLSMVKRYAHLSEAHTANVVASMNEKIFG
jgi:integrase